MNYIILFLSIVVLSACESENPGDGRESGTDKHEWSILQNMEYTNRTKKDIKFEIVEKSGYTIAVIPNKNGTGVVLVMLNPKSAPFYKQMPNYHFVLSKEQYNKIVQNASLISTVEEALKSHVLHENT